MGRTACALSIFLAACSSDKAGPSAAASASGKSLVMQADENEAKTEASARVAAAVEPIVAIPAGAFVAGSVPGDRGRNPTLEPSMTKVELGAFDVDRYLYPNELDKPPLTGVTRDKAAELCKARGRRLCTELEWEKACKGPGDDTFPGGDRFDPACGNDPKTCASGFGVLGMGAAFREWTASEVAEVRDFVAGAAATRGGSKDAAEHEHRCAHRTAVSAASSESILAFRCCGGAPNAKPIDAVPIGQTFARAEVPPALLGELFATIPQLRKLGTDIKYFDEQKAKDAITRADAGPAVPKNMELTTAPLLWNPVPGEEILVVTGAAGDSSFVVALYKLPEERYRIASSLILKNERGPIVIGYNASIGRRSKEIGTPRLFWATCWDCPSESGKITYRDDNRVVITQE